MVEIKTTFDNHIAKRRNNTTDYIVYKNKIHYN